jgi:hypothetical protein
VLCCWRPGPAPRRLTPPPHRTVLQTRQTNKHPPPQRWKTRNINSISFRALDMLYTPRQLMYYWNDQDLPW